MISSNIQMLRRTKGLTQEALAHRFNDEKVQKRLVAEAKFLRGFYYLDLVKNFGRSEEHTSELQ